MGKNFLIWLTLALVFAGIFWLNKDAATKEYTAHIATIPSVQMFGGASESMESLETLGITGGAIIGFLAFVLSGILLLILKIVRVPKRLAAAIAGCLAFGLIFALGTELAFFEEKNSPLASAIVLYFGKPLFYSSLLASIFAIVVFLMLIFNIKKNEITE